MEAWDPGGPILQLSDETHFLDPEGHWVVSTQSTRQELQNQGGDAPAPRMRGLRSVSFQLPCEEDVLQSASRTSRSACPGAVRRLRRHAMRRDWRRLGLSAEEVREFCVAQRANARAKLAGQPRGQLQPGAEGAPHRVLPRALHVQGRDAGAGGGARAPPGQSKADPAAQKAPAAGGLPAVAGRAGLLISAPLEHIRNLARHELTRTWLPGIFNFVKWLRVGEEAHATQAKARLRELFPSKPGWPDTTLVISHSKRMAVNAAANRTLTEASKLLELETQVIHRDLGKTQGCSQAQNSPQSMRCGRGCASWGLHARPAAQRRPGDAAPPAPAAAPQSALAAASTGSPSSPGALFS